MKKGRKCERKVKDMFKRVRFRSKKGMELVQVDKLTFFIFIIV